MNDDDLLKHSLFKKNPLHDILEQEKLWKEITKRDTILSDINKEHVALNALMEKALNDFSMEKALNDFSEKDMVSKSDLYLSPITFDHREAIESLDKSKKEKEAEELRRHNEKVAVGKEQVELLKEQVQKLTALLENSQNSNEQRDAVIHFMVQMMMQMEASQNEKKKSLNGVLMQISSLVAIGADLSGIYEFVESELEELAKED